MARTEVCKGCCPQGGAIFATTFVEIDDELVWAKQCNNCGFVKKFRKQKPRLTMDEICEMEDDSKLRNKHDRAKFHYFAEMGAQKHYERACATYLAMAKSRGITEVPVLCIPYYNEYHGNALYAEVRDRKTSAWSVDYSARQLFDMAERVHAKFEEDFGTEVA